jgi:hypothetical protein
MALWVSTALSLRGTPYGLAAVCADSRDEAIALIREAIETDPSDHPPTQQYQRELLADLEGSIDEVPEGVFIDWTPSTRPRPLPTVSAN